MGTVSGEAFAAFYDAAIGTVYGYLARRVLGDRGTAEDLTQDTFAAVVVAVSSGKPEALTMPWVLTVARHKLIDHYRRLEREQRRFVQLAARTNEEADEIDELAGLAPVETLELLRGVSPEHRMVLILKYCDGLSVEQIASDIDRSVHATYSLLGRARRALARDIEEPAS